MSSKTKSQEEIIAHFNKLRQEQRSLASKLSEIQLEQNEHRSVIEALSNVPNDRRCFRMIGGILVERTVGEIAPALHSNNEKIGKLVETLRKQLSEKGEEINGYIEKHNIQIKGASGGPAKKEQEEKSTESKSASGVLVSDTKA